MKKRLKKKFADKVFRRLASGVIDKSQAEISKETRKLLIRGLIKDFKSDPHVTITHKNITVFDNGNLPVKEHSKKLKKAVNSNDYYTFDTAKKG